MSVLVIFIPPRPRLAARTPEAEASWRAPSEFGFVFSADGLTVGQQGRAAPALLPKATSVVAVLAEADVSWQRIDVPKAPASRLRAALSGVLEEALLEDEAAQHVALAPGLSPGQHGWVAVMHRPWLVATLAALEGAGLQVDRVVPALAPQDNAHGHFFHPQTDDEAASTDAAPTLALACSQGATCLRLDGSLPRALLPTESNWRWTATPAAAAAAERWLGNPVAVQTEAERGLLVARSAWNLRQFDLLSRSRGLRAVREAWRGFLGPRWRPVRVGLVALAVVQLVGLNAWAWQQQRALLAKKDSMVSLLRSTHPGVRTVVDAPLQMQRETERLRTAAGRAGDGDLESMLGAAANAWPDGQGPVQTLRFEPGSLTLAAPGLGEPQLAQLRERLKPAGLSAEFAEGRVTIRRAAGTGGAT